MNPGKILERRLTGKILASCHFTILSNQNMFCRYQKETFQVYKLRTSNSVRDRNRETKKRAARLGKKPDLFDDTHKYYARTFICTHGWNFKPRGRGDRTNHTVRGIGCKARLNAVLNRDEGVYTVRISKHQSSHNHSVGPDEYTCYAETRKIESPGIKRVAKTMWQGKTICY